MPRKTTKAEPVKIQTNKDKVIKVFKGAKCEKTSKGFHICIKSGEKMKTLHFGFAKNESDAWKKAAHEVM